MRMTTKKNIREIISMIDLTSLNAHDNAAAITALCQKATTDLGTVAAVCVYPEFVKLAKRLLQGTAIKVATVINFPTGEEGIEQIIRDTRHALKDGADEIDMVFPYKAYLTGSKTQAINVVEQCRALCSADILLKVIIETGELPDRETIQAISRVVLEAGADFIKTSTGKTATGATPEAANAMLGVICSMQHDYPDKHFGLKVSGGIKTVSDALVYLNMAKHMNIPLRIGASSLLDELFLLDNRVSKSLITPPVE
jgi:deoxyribose-phosphate aldolase